MGFIVFGEVIVAVVGVVLVSRRMRSQVARWCFRLGISFLLVMFALFGGFIQLGINPYVWANATASGDTGISIEMKYYPVMVSGSGYLFHPMVDTQTLLATMKEQYPATVISGQSAHLVKDNWGYALYPEENMTNAYTLEAEILVVSQDYATSYDTISYDLPFPRRSLHNPEPGTWTSSQPSPSMWTVVSTCDYECMTEYYRPFTNVTQRDDKAFDIKITNGTFQLRPTHDGYTITKL